MSKRSTISVSVSPLLWLAPLPFVLAICLPPELPHRGAEPPAVVRVAVAPTRAQSADTAASAALLSP
jgi:hypothetical protein